MKGGKRFACLVLIPAAALLLCSLGPREKPGDSERITATGVLRLVGSEPFTRLVLSSPDGKEFFFREADTAALKPLVGKKLRVDGVVEKKVVRTADGKRIGDELVLSKVRVERLPE